MTVKILIISKVNGYIEENNRNKYLRPEKTLKNYEELWNKIKNFVRSITNNSDDYDEKYMNFITW